MDIILDIINSLLTLKPESVFVNSINDQYRNRGGLSKKQLQGLYDIASKTDGVHPGKLATLQAIILKKPNRYKSDIPQIKEDVGKNAPAHDMIEKILSHYPAHKRVLFLKAKADNRETITANEISELEKFCKLLSL
jgi:hypothetical protein